MFDAHKEFLPMMGYRKRLVQDLSRWRAAGILTDDAERQILADVAARGSGMGLASALAILASVLLGFAAVSFVAAHWETMSRALRLGLLLALIAGGYGAAGYFATRGQRMFSDAAILFAVALFGTSIALISQMFHIDGHPPDGVLLWMLGALLAGVVLRCNPALAFAMVLAVVWASMEAGDLNRVYWPFLAPWAAITAAFLWQRWQPGAHISGLALTLFVVTAGYIGVGPPRHDVVALVGIAAAAAAVAAFKAQPKFDAISGPLLGYGIATAFAGLFALQFVEKIQNGPLVMLAALTLVLLMAVIWFGVTENHRGAIWLGYIAFSIEIFALYLKTIGSILDTSLFFLVTGLLVAALAYAAWRLANRTQTERSAVA